MWTESGTVAGTDILLLHIIAVAVLFATERQVMFHVGGNLFVADLSALERGIPAGVEGDSLPRIQRSFIMADAVTAFTAFAVVGVGGDIQVSGNVA